MSPQPSPADQIVFHFQEIETQEEANHFSEALRAITLFSPKNITARYEETKLLLQSARSRYENPIMQVPSKVYIDAIRAYIFGFNEASIHYSSLSVELMLLRSLLASKAHEMIELKKQKKLTFWWLIHRAGVIRAEDTEVADKVRIMRNCYVHFQNQLMFSEIPEFPKLEVLLGPNNEELVKIRELDRSVKDKLNLVFPVCEELISAECLRFMKARRDLMNARVIKELANAPKEGLNAGLLVWNLAQWSLDQDSLDTIEWSSRLLTQPDYYVP